MKNTLVFLMGMACSLSSLSSFSQTEKGNFLAGGTISYDHTSTDNFTGNNLFLQPSASYFVAANLAVGIITNLSFESSSGPGIESSATSYSFGPTIRYYFLLGEKWAVFPKVDYAFGGLSYETSQGSQTVSGSNNKNVFGAGVGSTYFITKSVGIEAILGYRTSSNGRVVDSAANRFGVDIGFQIYLNRKE